MELGIAIPHTGPSASPAHARAVCQRADALGFACLWAVDHLVLPHHTDSPYVLGRRPTAIADGGIAADLAPNLEQLTTLSWVAGITDRIGLGTAVTVLTNRHAVLNARQLATLDLLSGGRLRVGVGVGWVREEADAAGLPWDHRGAHAEEHIALLRHLWCAEGELVEFHGEFYDLPPVHADPRPIQRPVPIYVGGHSGAALDRAGRVGDGWITAPMAPARVAELWPRVLDAAERAGRDPYALTLVACEAPARDRGRAELLGDYAAAGVDHLQVRLGPDPAAALDELEQLAELWPPTSPY
jgi:probable F420-dependent oxidoreductase